MSMKRENLPGLFLVAGELGLQGVYMVGVEARRAA